MPPIEMPAIFRGCPSRMGSLSMTPFARQNAEGIVVGSPRGLCGDE